MFREAHTLRVLVGRAAICRLLPSKWPRWPLPTASGFLSITQSSDELSIVCDEDCVPAGVRAERGRVVLEVQGPFELTAVGVLAGLSDVLARAEVPILAISTFDTDYLVIAEPDISRAIAALERAGHRVRA